MIRAPLPADAPQRQIVFVSSLISFTVIPGYAGYAPSKAALRMLADTLREECVLYDIDVRCCFPANILTPGFEVEERTKPEITKKIEGTAASETPEAVATKIIDRLEQGHKHITYQFEGDLVKVIPPQVFGLMEEHDERDDRTGSTCVRHDARRPRLHRMALCEILMAENGSRYQGGAFQERIASLAMKLYH
jgi:NAD(P)-dependent dehydrogenase (short-subunit alcohol dehydrogenase family)